MFPEYLWKEEKITWDEFVDIHNIPPTKAFKIYRAIKNLFESRGQELPDGVAYFSDEGWTNTMHRAMKWWQEICDLTFEDFA